MPLLKYSIISIIIILVGGIVLLASEVWNPNWDPFKKTEEQLIEKALINTLINQKSYKIKEKISLETEKKGSIFLENVGVVDQSNVKNIKGDFLVDIKLLLETGESIQLKVNIKVSGQTFYFKITEMPLLFTSLLSMVNKEIAEMIGKHWIKIDLEQIKKIKEKMDFMEEKQEKQREENFEKLKEEIKDLVSNKKFFEIRNKNLDKIDDTSVIYYSTGLKKETIKELVPQLLKTGAQYIPNINIEELNSVIENFEKEFEVLWQEIFSGLQFDFWIEEDSKKGFLVRRIKFEKDFDSSTFIPSEVKTEANAEKLIEKIKFSIDVQFSDFNKEVNIELPTESKLLEELISFLLSSLSKEDKEDNEDLNYKIKEPISPPEGLSNLKDFLSDF